MSPNSEATLDRERKKAKHLVGGDILDKTEGSLEVCTFTDRWRRDEPHTNCYILLSLYNSRGRRTYGRQVSVQIHEEPPSHYFSGFYLWMGFSAYIAFSPAST